MNEVYELIAIVLDLLSGGSLDYKHPHGAADNRIDAGLYLLMHNRIAETPAPGYYIVTSEDKKHEYHVSAIHGDLSCTCEDALISTKNEPKTGICKHQICAVVYEAQRQLFAQMDAAAKTERSAA